MNRLKYLFLLLLIVSLCCACGKTEKNHSDDTDNQTSTELSLPENVEEIVPGIGVALDLDGDVPVISFYDYSDDTASALYTYKYLINNLPQSVENCEIFIYTVEESIETSLKLQKETTKWEDAGLPSGWVFFVKEKGIASSKVNIDSLVTKALAEDVEAGVQEHVLDVMAKYYVDDKTDNSAETEDSEASGKLIKHEEYEVEQIKVILDLTRESDNSTALYVGVESDVAWKLAYSYIAYSTLAALDELNIIVLAYNEDVILSTIGVSADLKTNKTIDASEWCAEQIANRGYDAEESKALTDELYSLVLEFLESIA